MRATGVPDIHTTDCPNVLCVAAFIVAAVGAAAWKAIAADFSSFFWAARAVTPFCRLWLLSHTCGARKPSFGPSEHCAVYEGMPVSILTFAWLPSYLKLVLLLVST